MIPAWWQYAPNVARSIGMQCSEEACTANAWALIGTRAFCWDCGAGLLNAIDNRAFKDESVHAAAHGTPTLARPDVGEGWHDLRCQICKYEWLGRAGEYCAACAKRYDVIAAGKGGEQS